MARNSYPTGSICCVSKRYQARESPSPYHCPLSHLFEAWARDPAALLLLSSHWRLGSPLPRRDAAALAACVFSAGAASAAELHEQLLVALADTALHALPASAFGEPCGDGSMSVPVAAAAEGGSGMLAGGQGLGGDVPGDHGGGGVGGCCVAAQVFDAVWAAHGLPAAPRGGTGSGGSGAEALSAVGGLEALRSIEALGAVGGAKWGYAAARLLAAAAAKRWLGGGALDTPGGAELKARLLYGLGAGDPPQTTLGQLLGPGALVPWDAPSGGGRAESGDWAGGGAGPDAAAGVAGGGGAGLVRCWLPDLGHEAFQDVDLLG